MIDLLLSAVPTGTVDLPIPINFFIKRPIDFATSNTFLDLQNHLFPLEFHSYKCYFGVSQASFNEVVKNKFCFLCFLRPCFKPGSNIGVYLDLIS